MLIKSYYKEHSVADFSGPLQINDEKGETKLLHQKLLSYGCESPQLILSTQP